jgi:hypothetical protein
MRYAKYFNVPHKQKHLCDKHRRQQKTVSSATSAEFHCPSSEKVQYSRIRSHDVVTTAGRHPCSLYSQPVVTCHLSRVTRIPDEVPVQTSGI